MVRLELAALVEIEGQGVVDLNRREMRVRPVIGEPEDPREKLRRGDLVVGPADLALRGFVVGPHAR